MTLLAPVIKNWREQCLLWSPSSFDATPYTLVMIGHAEMLAQINQTSGNALHREANALLLIAPRFFIRAITAVRFLIVSIVVNPIQNQSRRFLSHVCEEVFELLPRSAKGYAPASPLRIMAVVRIRAALNHVAPRLVGFAFSVASCVTVRLSLAEHFSQKTPTRPGCARNQCAVARFIKTAAIAQKNAVSNQIALWVQSCSALAKHDTSIKSLSVNVELIHALLSFHASSFSGNGWVSIPCRPKRFAKLLSDQPQWLRS